MLYSWIAKLGQRITESIDPPENRKFPIKVKARLAYFVNDPREEEFYFLKIENHAVEKIMLMQIWYESETGNRIPYVDINNHLPFVIRANREKEIRFPSGQIKNLGDKTPENNFRVTISGDESVYRSAKDESGELAVAN